MNDKEFLGYLEDLKSQDINKQITSSENIMKSLIVESSLPQDIIPVSKQSQLGTKVSADLDFTIRKLIKGSTAQIIHIQIAFSQLLGSILNKFKEIELASFIQMVVNECHTKNSIKKSEHSFFINAKLLILLQIARSSVFDSNRDVYQQFYQIVLAEIQNNPWTSQQCISIIEQSLLDKDNKFAKEKVNQLSKQVKTYLKESSVEYLMIQIILYKTHKHVLKENYSQLANIDKKIFNQNKLTELMGAAIQSYPKEHICIRIVMGFVLDQIEAQKHSQQIETMSKFWKFLFNEYVGISMLEDIVEEEKEKEEKEEKEKSKYDIRKFNLALCFLKRFVKDSKFKIGLLATISNEYIGFWLKQMNVNNKVLKKQGMKIWNQIEQKLKTQKEELVQSKEMVYNFLIGLKQRPIQKFRLNQQMAKLILESLDGQQIEQYFVFLKKKSKMSESCLEKMYYMNEIFVLGDNQVGNMDLVKKICQYVVREGEKQNVMGLMEKEWEIENEKEKDPNIKEEKFSLNVENYENVREKILDPLFSIIQSVQNSIKQKELLNKEGTKIEQSIRIVKAQNEQLLQILGFIQKENKEVQEIEEQIKKMKKGTDIEDLQKMGLVKLKLAILIQSFEHQEESEDALQEIKVIESKMGVELKDVRKKKIKKEEKDEPKCIHVLIDLLVSQLTKSHSFIRQVINDCFSSLIEQIDQVGVDNIVQVLIRPNQEYIQDMVNNEERDDDEMEEEQ